MTSPSQDTYATADELVNFWKPLTDVQKSRATFLLSFAHMILGRIRPGLADAASTDAELAKAAQFVSLYLVQECMAVTAGVATQSKTMGPYSNSVTYTSPKGDLVVTDFHRELLGIETKNKSTFFFGDGVAYDRDRPQVPWSSRRSHLPIGLWS